MPRFSRIAVALLIFPLLLAGCGSENGPGGGASAEPSPSPGRGIVTTIAPSGPDDAGANLEQLVRNSNPEFDDIRIACPAVEDPPSYPFRCRLNANDRERGVGVGGTVTVHGVYAPTMTYAFAMSYEPRDSG